MSVDDDFSDLIGLFYDAALDAAQWPLVLFRIAGLVEAESGLLAIGSWRRLQDGLELRFGASAGQDRRISFA